MNSFLYILAFYFAGEYLTELLHLSFPGSVSGFLLALLAVLLVPATASRLRVGSDFLLSLLPLFLVPVAVSIFFLFIRMGNNIYSFAGIVFVALFFGIVVSALAMGYFLRFFYRGERKPDE